MMSHMYMNETHYVVIFSVLFFIFEMKNDFMNILQEENVR